MKIRRVKQALYCSKAACDYLCQSIYGHASPPAAGQLLQQFIQKNPHGRALMYADEGITGTSTAHRTEFKRLIADCDAGKIDLVFVKSGQPLCP